jgi:hypothetical protein
LIDVLIVREILNPNKGNILFYLSELGYHRLNHRPGNVQVRVRGEHDFIGMLGDRGELRGSDIAVNEEDFIGIGLGEVIDLGPFSIGAIEIICHTYSYNVSYFHMLPFMCAVFGIDIACLYKRNTLNKTNKP